MKKFDISSLIVTLCASLFSVAAYAEIETPDISASTSCDVAPVFSLENYADTVTYVWRLDGTEVTPEADNTYTVTSPENGKTYAMEVTAAYQDLETLLVESKTGNASATYYATPAAAPKLSASEFGCGDDVKFTIDNYEPSYTYSWKVNDAAVTATGSTYTVENPVNMTVYKAEVAVSNNGCDFPEKGNAEGAYILKPETPDITVNDGCGNDVIFTVANYSPVLEYAWVLDGVQLTVEGDSYKVPDPNDGEKYTMAVISKASIGSYGPCTSDRAVASQTYKAIPTLPVATAYNECATTGMGKWEDLVTITGTYTLVWYADETTETPMTQAPADFDKSIVGNKVYFVAQKSTQGCIGSRVKVSVTVKDIPIKPVTTAYTACPVVGKKAWSSLVTASGTLNWYTSETSVGSIPDPGEFDMSVTQTTSYWVSQTTDVNCESKRAEVKITIYDKPQAPVVTNYVGCQESGTGKWADLVSVEAGNTLRWYESETSTVVVTTVPDYNKNIPGVKSCWVSAYSANGCESDRVEVIVKIMETPTVYAGDAHSVCSGTTTTLGEVSSASSAIKYSWEPVAMLVDPTVSNPVTRAMTQTTTFTVTAYNESMSACYATSSVTVTVVENPVVELKESLISLCPQGGATFENKTSESDVAYSWEPVDKIQGTYSSYKMTTKPLDETTTFTLTASRKLYPSQPSSVEKCSTTANAVAQVVANPVAFAGNDATVCIGETHRLGTSSVFGVDYSWVPADKVDNPAVSNPNTTAVTEDVEYTLTAKLHAAPYCSSTDKVLITKVNKPTTYNVSGDNNYCSSESTAAMIVTLDGSDVNTEYALLRDGKVVADYQKGTGSSLKWYDNPAGVYTVKARVINTTCEQEMSGSATIVARQSPTATIAYKSKVACPGQTTTIQVVFQGDAPFTYSISENGETKHTGTTSENVYEYDLTPTGNTVIKLESLEDAYCKNSFSSGDNPTLVIDIEALSDFLIHSSQTTEMICPGDNVELSIDYTGTRTHYQWSTGDKDVPAITVQPTQTSTYSIYAETDVTHCILTDTVTIKVVSKETFRIEGLRDPMNYCSSETNVTVTGYPTGGSFSTKPASVLVGTNTLDFSKITKTGTVELTYTYGQQGCKFDTTMTINVSALLTEIDWMVVPDFGPPYQKEYNYCLKNDEDENKNYPLQGYPQQKNGKWKVEANLEPGATSNAKITITDENKAQANLSDVSAGTYFITYYVKDEFGCEASKTKNLIIRKDVQELVDMKGFTYEPNSDGTVCQKSQSAVIKANNTSGVFTMSPSSAIISQASGVLTFNPSVYGQGSKSAIYTIVDETGCPHNYSAPFKVVAPVNVSVNTSRSTYCSYDDDDAITVTSLTPTDGTISIYRCASGVDCSDENNWTLVESGIYVTKNPMFRPTWGSGEYKIVYDYDDGYCEWHAYRYVNVYDPTPISMNLNYDYCKGDVIKLAATPSGGFYTAPDAPESALINTTFYTENSGLGQFTITYEVNNEYGCTSQDTTQILVRGTENVKILNLPERFCSPEGSLEFSGSPNPNNKDSVYFSGPSFLSGHSTPRDSLHYATIDLSKANFSTTYNVTYHYVQAYKDSLSGLPATCESKATKSFKVLNESSDFAGYDHLSYLCGDKDYVEIAANHSDNTDFIFSDATVHPDAFKDNGDGTGVIYPKQLPEGMYSITMYHYLVDDGDTICSTSKAKSFYIERLLDIPEIGLYCKDGDNAVKMSKTEVDVKYTLYVNNNYFEDQTGDGGPIYYDAIPLDIANCKIEAYSNGCRYAMSKVIEVEKLKMEFTTKNISCNGQVDGQFQSTVTGGRYKYKHELLDKAAATIVVKDSVELHLAAKEYTYTVTDSVGCQRTTDFTITEPDLLTVTIEKQDVNCTGTNTGILRAMPDGGTTPYSYEWVDLNSGVVMGTEATLVNVPSGEYKVTITDGNGCTTFATEILVAPLPLSVTVTNVKNVEIIGEATGAIDIAATGGVKTDAGDYIYFWTGKSITSATEALQNQTDLLAGNYYVTVTDARGCKAETSAEVTEPTPYIVTSNIKNVSCNGGSDGYIYLDIQGVQPPYSYTWTLEGVTVGTTKDLLNIKSGIYHVDIEDVNGNKYSNDYKVTEPDLLTIAKTITSNVEEKCYGDATANIDVTIEGGTAPYNVTWIGVTEEQITDSTHIKNLYAGTYQINVIDNLGCAASFKQDVTQPDAPLSIASDNVTNLICNGTGDGKIEITPAGGTPDYTYSWSGTGSGINPTAQNQTTLSGGDYEVWVEDANGCHITKSYSVSEPTAIELKVDGKNLECFQNGNGKVWAEVSGGAYPYAYQWNDQVATVLPADSVLTTLPADKYDVTVTDALGCTKSGSVTITEPDKLEIVQASSFDVTCNGDADGRVIVDEVKGGTPVYTYAWVNMDDESTVISTRQEVTNLAPGMYKVTVTDTEGCSDSYGYIEVGEPDLLTVSIAVGDVAVHGEATGVITTAAAGGTAPYTYEWKSGPSIDDTNRYNATLTGILAGSYYEVVNDVLGCTHSDIVVVKQPEALIFDAVTKNLNCNGDNSGSITINVQGGDGIYSYNWTKDGAAYATTKDILALAAGTYKVEVSDASGAKASAEYIITEPDKLKAEVIPSGTQLTVSCYGDKSASIKVAFSGGTKPYNVVWNGPDIPAIIADSSYISSLGVGTYTMAVTDVNGCVENTLSQTVTGPVAPIEITGVVTNTKCSEDTDGSIKLTVTGGTAPYTFKWSGDEGLVPDTQDQSTLVSGGTYTVEVTDANGCTKSKTFKLEDRTELKFALESQSVTCNGLSDGKLSAQVTGGTGEYSPEWRNSDGTWKYTGLDAENVSADEYTFTVKDAVGCEKTGAIQVTEPDEMSVSITSSSVLCNGLNDGEAYADVPEGAGTKPYTYTWYKNDVLYAHGARITNLEANFYKVVVKDKNGCSASAQTTINSSTPIVIQLVDKQDVTVHGEATGSITVSVSGGTAPLSYLWSGIGIDPAKQTELNQNNLIAGKYHLTVTDFYSCTKELNVEIFQPESMTVTSNVKYIDCPGDKAYIELTVTGGYPPYTCEWTSQEKAYHSTDFKIYDLEADTYFAVIKDKQDNVYKTSFTIPGKEDLVWELLESSKDVLTCHGDKDGFLNISVTGGTAPYSIEWHGPDLYRKDVTNIMDLGVGEYSAYIKDAKGCEPAQQFSHSVTAPDTLTLEAVIVNNHCYGLSEGSITLNVQGGVPGYTYQWAGFVADPAAKDQTDLVESTYHLRLADDNGCEIDTTFNITAPDQLKSTITGGADLCRGDELTLYMNFEGVSPWDVTYTDGATATQVQLVDAFSEVKVSPSFDATYSLLNVTDADGCTSKTSGSVDVKVHTVPTATILSVDKDCCLGDVINVELMFSNPGPWTVYYTDGSHEFTDGPFTEQSTTLQITPTQVGTTHYEILSVSNDNCKSDVGYKFDVETFYYPNLSVDLPASICQPNQIEMVMHPTGTSPWKVSYKVNGQHYEADVKSDGEIIKFDPVREDNLFIFESIQSGERCKTLLGKQQQVNVGLLPSDASLITGPNLICRNAEVSYHTTSIENADKYVWQLPADFTIISGAGSPDIVVSIGPGATSGDVLVYGENSCGKGNESKYAVEIIKTITAKGVISAPQFVCEGDSMISISVSDVEGATYYEWTLPSGYTINSGQGTMNILVSLGKDAVSGSVKVVPKNECQNGEASTAYLTLRKLPKAEAGVDFNTHCLTSATLQAEVESGCTVKWTIVEGSGTLLDPVSPVSDVEDLQFGNNKFRLDVSDSYCSNYDTVVITNDNPGITDPEVTEMTLCEDSVLLRAVKPLNGSGRWTLIAGSGTLRTPDSNESMIAGLSTKVINVVRWEVYHAACSNTIDVDIVSHDLHKLADAGKRDTTVNGTYRLSAKILNDPSVRGTWSVEGGNGVFDNTHVENTTVRGLASGVNTFRWTVEGYGCTAYSEVQIESLDEPIARFSMSDSMGCAPLKIYFDNLTIGDATYEWDFGDGSDVSTLRSPEHVYTKSGRYVVTLTATGINEKNGKRKVDAISKVVYIYTNPNANFTSSANLVYMGSADNKPTVQFYDRSSDSCVDWYWDFGDDMGYAKEKNPQYTYKSDGLYDVKLVVTDKNGCRDSLVEKGYITVAKESFIVYPTAFAPLIANPSDGYITSDERRLDVFYPVFRNVDTYTLKIYNQWGVQIFQSDEVLKGWNGWYNGQCAAQGTYVYKAEGRYKDGTTFRSAGNIMLIR